MDRRRGGGEVEEEEEKKKRKKKKNTLLTGANLAGYLWLVSDAILGRAFVRTALKPCSLHRQRARVSCKL